MSYFSGFTTKGNGGKDKRGGIDLRPTGCTGAIPNDYMEFMMEHKYGKMQMEYCYRSEGGGVCQLKYTTISWCPKILNSEAFFTFSSASKIRTDQRWYFLGIHFTIKIM